MTILGYSISFFISWWLFLFMVLPFGITSHSELDEEIKDGIEVGAPVQANIKKKMWITTGITVCFIILVGFVDYFDLVSIK